MLLTAPILAASVSGDTVAKRTFNSGALSGAPIAKSAKSNALETNIGCPPIAAPTELYSTQAKTVKNRSKRLGFSKFGGPNQGCAGRESEPATKFECQVTEVVEDISTGKPKNLTPKDDLS